MRTQASYAFDEYCLKCSYKGYAGCAGFGFCRERFAAGADWDRKDSIATAEDVMLKAEGSRDYLQGGTMARRIVEALKDEK